MGHFSGWAGGVALAVLVIPVVVRTTEDMLTLVPNALREAATSIGLPRSMSITHICYRAARAGMVTGVLLAVARISGETAPLLFTSLNNQFWSTNLNAPMASLPVVIFQFALSPYKDWQALAWTGALIITLAVLALSITARALVHREDSHECRFRRRPYRHQCASRSGRPRRKGHDPQSRFLLRRLAGAEIDQPAALREQGHRLHRSVGLRQVDLAARAQPHVRPLSAPARHRRGHVRRRQYPVAAAGPQSAARAHRHGVPEADAVPDVDLREHRLRHQAVRAPAEIRARRPRGDLAAARRAVGRGQGQARRQRPEPVRRPAAAPVHRAHRRGAAGGDPVRRAVLGARSDLDRQDRGADRRIDRRLHDRDRHSQHAAGRARIRVHRLHVSRRTDRVRFDRARCSRRRKISARRTTSPAASGDRS